MQESFMRFSCFNVASRELQQSLKKTGYYLRISFLELKVNRLSYKFLLFGAKTLGACFLSSSFATCKQAGRK